MEYAPEEVETFLDNSTVWINVKSTSNLRRYVEGTLFAVNFVFVGLWILVAETSEINFAI